MGSSPVQVVGGRPSECPFPAASRSLVCPTASRGPASRPRGLDAPANEYGDGEPMRPIRSLMRLRSAPAWPGECPRTGGARQPRSGSGRGQDLPKVCRILCRAGALPPQFLGFLAILRVLLGESSGITEVLGNLQKTSESPGFFAFRACSVRGGCCAVFCAVLGESALFGALSVLAARSKSASVTCR